LGSVGFLLSVMTVFLSCNSLASEIRLKHIIMVASKPIPRWQFFAGKWLGIVTLNAALLLLSGTAIWASTLYLKSRPTDVPGDREGLQSEVLSARHASYADKPDFTLMVDERIRKLREEGRIEKTNPNTEAGLRNEIEEEIHKTWWSLGPREGREFVFKNLLVDRGPNHWVHVRLKPYTPSLVDDLPFKVWYQAGDHTDANTLMPESSTEVLALRYTVIPVPTQAVNADGTLYFRFVNLDPKNSLGFQTETDLMVLFDVGTFHWNLFRALTIIWCQLAFLSVVGLTASAFLSFPVACMGCFLVLFVSIAGGFLSEAVEWLRPAPYGTDPLWIGRMLVRNLVGAFLWLVPDFSQFDPVGNIVDGRNVTLMWVIKTFVVLILLKGFVVGILGGIIFTRRELAQVTV
jgi:hypothetical protein